MNSKIIKLDDVGTTCRNIKKEGKTIAHCHGCFDLLHPGHIKHFEAAKKLADILVVTVTPDRYVNKGPGRPVFNEQIRLESLAAIESIDYVALNNWPTAIETIKIVQPDYYVKGQDYKNRENDLTKNIFLEEDALKAIGGKIHFTEEITFSSSNLINTFLNPLDEQVQEYLHDFKKSYNADKIIKEIDALSKLKVLVIGDTIIDEYYYCKTLGRSSKSPNLSTKYLKGIAYAGGTLAIANHLAEFSKNVHLVTCLGKEHSQTDVIESKLSHAVEKKFFYRNDGPTNTKRRYLDIFQNNKIFEVTFMNDHLINEKLNNEIIIYLKKKINDYDLILIADFGHGFITPRMQECLTGSQKTVAVNAQTNSNNYGYNYITKYSNVDFISIDENEIRLPFGDKFGDLNDLIIKLKEITCCSNICITLGQKGSLYYSNGEFYKVPAFATAVKDPVGAGDAALAVTSLCATANFPSDLIPFIGNCAGALAVTIVGNEHPVYKNDLCKFVEHFLK